MSTAGRETQSRGPVSGVEALAGKYLTFALGEAEYGLPVRKVREIIKMAPVTAVPHVAPWIKGVINLRGKVIPVTDLRVRFNLPAVEYTERTCIVVLEISTKTTASLMGIIVDTVSDVMSIAAAQLEEPPRFGAEQKSPYLDALAKVKGTVKMILNLDQVCGDAAAAVAPGVPGL